jgi:RND family efflux transporter MFP subunit
MITKRFAPIIGAFACLALVACQPKESGNSSPVKTEQALSVVLEPTTLTPQYTRIETVGTSEAYRSITIFPESSGEVTRVHFRPGQLVKEGDVLLTLESRDEVLAVELAEVRQAEAERLYKRYLESAGTGATLPTTLDAARAELEAAKIALRRAQIALDDRQVLAPFTGHVGITNVEVGDRIQTSSAVTSLDDRSQLLVSFNVPETMVGQLDVGDNINIASWSTAGTTAVGEVYEVDSRISPSTRTFVTRARVVNDSDHFRPGMSFRVTLDVRGRDYPVLPEIALQWGANGSYIWLARDGMVERVPVDIVQRQQGRVLVEAEIKAGDLVVVEGLQRLRPGARVAPNTAVATKTANKGHSG